MIAFSLSRSLSLSLSFSPFPTSLLQKNNKSTLLYNNNSFWKSVVKQYTKPNQLCLRWHLISLFYLFPFLLLCVLSTSAEDHHHHHQHYHYHHQVPTNNQHLLPAAASFFQHLSQSLSLSIFCQSFHYQSLCVCSLCAVSSSPSSSFLLVNATLSVMLLIQ